MSKNFLKQISNPKSEPATTAGPKKFEYKKNVTKHSPISSMNTIRRAKEFKTVSQPKSGVCDEILTVRSERSDRSERTKK